MKSPLMFSTNDNLHYLKYLEYFWCLSSPAGPGRLPTAATAGGPTATALALPTAAHGRGRLTPEAATPVPVLAAGAPALTATHLVRQAWFGSLHGPSALFVLSFLLLLLLLLFLLLFLLLLLLLYY